MKYCNQRHEAKRRGIEFLLTFEEWLTWWGDDLPMRGRSSSSLVMARHGDKGPYALWNIKKITTRANALEAEHFGPWCEAASKRMLDRNSARIAAGIPHHLAVRGDGHPKSKPVITPDGRFGSCALAAEFYGITRQAMHLRIKAKPDAYRFES